MANFLKSLFVKGIEIDPDGATSAQVLSYNGTKFVPAAAAAGGSSVTVSDTAPVSPTAGDVWYESDTGILFVRYDSYWVEVGGAIGSTGTTGATGATGATGPGDALIANPLSQFAATTSTQLAGVISDETGTGSLVFSTSPTFTGTPTLPTGTIATTQTAADSSTKVATTEFVTTAIPVTNLLTNGAMRVAQRNTSVASLSNTGGTYHTADRFAFTVINTAGTWTQSVANDAPTGSGFTTSLKLLCTTATATLGASSLCFVSQRIEGQNVQSICKGTASAKTLTLSFWVKALQTGTYIASLYDHPNNRNVAQAYTISVTNTWEYKTLIFPADTTGAFNNDSSVGLQVNWSLAAGSTYSSGTLATTWATYVAANEFVGATNVASAINNYWQMTGAQLTVGSAATPFEERPIGTELALCQRYYQVSNGSVGTYANNGGNPTAYLKTVVTMRATPTLTVITAPSYTNASALTGDQLSKDGNRFYITVTALGVGYADNFVYSLSAEL